MTTQAEILSERRKLVEEGPVVFLNRCALESTPTKRIRRAFWLMFGNHANGLDVEFCKEYVTRAIQIEHAEAKGDVPSGRIKQRFRTLTRRLERERGD